MLGRGEVVPGDRAGTIGVGERGRAAQRPELKGATGDRARHAEGGSTGGKPEFEGGDRRPPSAAGGGGGTTTGVERSEGRRRRATTGTGGGGRSRTRGALS